MPILPYCGEDDIAGAVYCKSYLSSGNSRCFFGVRGAYEKNISRAAVVWKYVARMTGGK